MMTPEARGTLEYHWQQYKPMHSGVTVSRLGQVFLEMKAPRDDQNPIFKEIMSPTPAKLECFVNHQIGCVIAKLKTDVEQKDAKFMNLLQQKQILDKRASDLEKEAQKAKHSLRVSETKAEATIKSLKIQI